MDQSCATAGHRGAALRDRSDQRRGGVEIATEEFFKRFGAGGYFAVGFAAQALCDGHLTIFNLGSKLACFGNIEVEQGRNAFYYFGFYFGWERKQEFFNVHGGSGEW